MQNPSEIIQVKIAVQDGSVLKKSEDELVRMSAVINSWIASGIYDPNIAPSLREAVENRLAHLRALKLSGQTENLNTQTNRLVEETIVLRKIAESQIAFAHSLDRLTKWLVALTVVIVLLTLAVLVFTVYLYQDAHAQIQRDSTATPHKTVHP